MHEQNQTQDPLQTMRVRVRKWLADRLEAMMGRRAYDATVPEDHPARVLALIPRSHFTKTGPGVRANARRAFYSLTPAQRRTAVRRGWFPLTMLSRKERESL